MTSVEINDAVECDFVIAEDRPQPDTHHARSCTQCGKKTWASTASCMWCGYDRVGNSLRWVAAGVLLVVVLTLIRGVAF